jgi:phosphoribosylamine--glycine ligase/phosphoribosylformylglycinamidine cyclo-ligase
MLTSEGPKVLEYNVRFGDPETEALMLLLDEKTDLAEIMLVSPFSLAFSPPFPGGSDSLCPLCLARLQSCVERRLDSVKLSYREGYAISVILASGGYPGKYPTGIPITIGSLPSG